MIVRSLSGLRRILSRRPRRSKNGTQEERAAKLAAARTHSATVTNHLHPNRAEDRDVILRLERLYPKRNATEDLATIVNDILRHHVRLVRRIVQEAVRDAADDRLLRLRPRL